MPTTFHSGFGGWVTIGGNQVPLKNWRLSDKNDLAKFKNSMTGKRALYEPTYSEGSVTLSLAYDFSNDPFGAYAGFQAGAVLANLVLGLNQSDRVAMTLDGPAHTATIYTVESVDQTVTTTSGEEIPVTVTGFISGTIVFA